MKLKATTTTSAISAPCCRTRLPMWGRRALICPARVVTPVGSAGAVMSGCDETSGISEFSIGLGQATAPTCFMAQRCPSLLCFALTLEEDRQHNEQANDDAGDIVGYIERYQRL